jgi:hypothetical protein
MYSVPITTKDAGRILTSSKIYSIQLYIICKKHIYKTKDRVLNNGGELRCSGRVGSFCSTSDTRRVNLVANPVISHGRGKDWGHRGRDRMVAGFTSTYAISTYHH